MIRVLLVDDHALTRLSLRAAFEPEDDIEVVGEAADGAAALAACRRHQPDVVVMDLRMPGMDGVEATRRLTATPDGPRVLVLTTYEVDTYVVDALSAGAGGFLLKDATPEQLADGVRVVAAGDTVLAPMAMRTLMAQVTSRTAPTPDMIRRRERLTDRETEVLRMLADGLSNAEIAGRIFVAETTVKTHVSRLLAKLELRSRAQAATWAHQAGLV